MKRFAITAAATMLLAGAALGQAEKGRLAGKQDLRKCTDGEAAKHLGDRMAGCRKDFEGLMGKVRPPGKEGGKGGWEFPNFDLPCVKDKNAWQGFHEEMRKCADGFLKDADGYVGQVQQLANQARAFAEAKREEALRIAEEARRRAEEARQKAQALAGEADRLAGNCLQQAEKWVAEAGRLSDQAMQKAGAAQKEAADQAGQALKLGQQYLREGDKWIGQAEGWRDEAERMIEKGRRDCEGLGQDARKSALDRLGQFEERFRGAGQRLGGTGARARSLDRDCGAVERRIEKLCERK